MFASPSVLLQCIGICWVMVNKTAAVPGMINADYSKEQDENKENKHLASF